MDDLFSLLEQLAVSPDAGKKVSVEKSELAFDEITLSLKDRSLSFAVRGSLVAFPVIPEEEIEAAIGGKKRADAENILRADSRVKAFGVSLFPFWRNTIPSGSGKIRILVSE